MGLAASQTVALGCQPSEGLAWQAKPLMAWQAIPRHIGVPTSWVWLPAKQWRWAASPAKAWLGQVTPRPYSRFNNPTIAWPSASPTCMKVRGFAVSAALLAAGSLLALGQRPLPPRAPAD